MQPAGAWRNNDITVVGIDADSFALAVQVRQGDRQSGHVQLARVLRPHGEDILTPRDLAWETVKWRAMVSQTADSMSAVGAELSSSSHAFYVDHGLSVSEPLAGA